MPLTILPIPYFYSLVPDRRHLYLLDSIFISFNGEEIMKLPDRYTSSVLYYYVCTVGKDNQEYALNQYWDPSISSWELSDTVLYAFHSPEQCTDALKHVSNPEITSKRKIYILAVSKISQSVYIFWDEMNVHSDSLGRS